VAVNLSGREFDDPGLADRIERALLDFGVPASALEIELTESVAVRQPQEALAALEQLRALGVQVAIDDFGTGYSVLSSLQRFPVDRLKIDRSFVTSITEGSDDRAIAAAIIAMSRSLRISVTAEGVENFPQLAFLQQQDCQDAQGFLLSHPLHPDAARELLRRVNEVGDASRTQRLKAITG
jgi:EAL domain-containing protein (putative c-di-GMP-specific phosphodiesterase class I)